MFSLQDVHIKTGSLLHFVNNSPLPPEQHFYPSSLSFGECICTSLFLFYTFADAFLIWVYSTSPFFICKSHYSQFFNCAYMYIILYCMQYRFDSKVHLFLNQVINAILNWYFLVEIKNGVQECQSRMNKLFKIKFWAIFLILS